MNETRWTLPTPDGHLIYGCTNTQTVKPTRAIVITHGLNSHINAYHHKTTAHFFAGRGYDVFRFNLYDGEHKARRLEDCTLKEHSSDLNTVIAAKAASYDKLFLIGHSYGGPTVMIAQNPNATAVSLWDPSFDLPRQWSDRSDMKQIGGLSFFDWGSTILLGDAMIAEAESRYGRDECLELSRSFARPIQVIHAEGRADETVSWHSAGHPVNERHVVPGADHCFYNGDTLSTAHALTEKFFSCF